jgi:isoquinoline 1-oxidoreductase beta subunit
MKFAVIERPPVELGKAVSFDEAAAMKVPGVVKVVMIPPTPMPAKFAPLGGVAVIADSTWAAMKGRQALKVTWDDGPNKSYNSDSYKEQMQAQARKPGKIERNEGDIDKALAGAAKVVEREYYIPHGAHVPMEPPAAVVQIKDGKADVWACVQSPGGTRGDVAKQLGMKEEDVTVHVTLLGGGFGRKSKCDFALEAAILSKSLGGTPVKVVWTREDDLQHGFYHSVSYQHVTAGLDKNNKVVAWRQRSVSPSLMSNFMPDPKRESALELGLGLIDTPFNVPNLRLETGEAVAQTRIGWFRSVNNIPHAFAMQSMVAELAAELGKDPKDFLLEMIGPPRIVDPRKTVTSELWNYGDPWDTYPVDTSRTRRVVEIAADKAGWGRKLPKGHGMGIAVQRSFLTYVATVVEVAVDDKGNVSVPRVDTAIDCGFAVNPERIRSQIEGACVMGLSQAVVSEITFKNGRAQQDNFHQFEIVRMNVAPKRIVVHDGSLRAIATATCVYQFSFTALTTVYLLFVTRTLELPGAVVGLVLAAFGPGVLIGSLLSSWLPRWFGYGRIVVFAALISDLVLLCTSALHGSGPAVVAALITINVLYGVLSQTVDIAVTAIRQAVTPLPVQGRVVATINFLGMGLTPLGALLGGTAAGAFGIRTALLTATAGLFLSPLALSLSPLARLGRSLTR